MEIQREDKLGFTIRQVIHDQNITDDEIMRSWRAVKISMEQKRKRSELSVYEDEYSILSKYENENEDNFSSYTATIPQKYKSYFEQIAVVDRLTVTQAFTGFTRITRNEANSVAISQYPKPWLPAVELTGEGIFIRFNKDKIAESDESSLRTPCRP